jgi:hypothetical protein
MCWMADSGSCCEATRTAGEEAATVGNAMVVCVRVGSFLRPPANPSSDRISAVSSLSLPMAEAGKLVISRLHARKSREKSGKGPLLAPRGETSTKRLLNVEISIFEIV